MKTNSIPVIDLFAGPGGLGEGFGIFKHRSKNRFRICLSIEKNCFAFRTLKLRSLFRKISFDQLRDAYVAFAKTKRNVEDELALFSNFKKETEEAEREVLCKELGSDSFPEDEIDNLIRDRLNGASTWILIGGPPCQAYSLAGRSRMSRIRREDLKLFEKDERHYLYQHYLRIISVHQPPVFVMENVKGMLSSTINGKLIVDQILEDLKNPSADKDLKYNLYPFVKSNHGLKSLNDITVYKASDFVIQSENFGIPQCRHRVIILGVRADINVLPKQLKRHDSMTCLREIISDLPRIRSEVSFRGDRKIKWGDHIRKIQNIICESNTLSREIRYKLSSYLKFLGDDLSTGGEYLKYLPGRPKRIVSEMYRDQDMKGVCNHESKCHMPTDLLRYFFASCYANIQDETGCQKSPLLRDFPPSLLPNHKNIEQKTVNKVEFDDRFRVQLWDKPATTITSHIAKDGHYFIHPDPCQSRSLTVREAARIQTFPDSYLFLGSKTSQYEQVGNAVPPKLAEQLAEVVYGLLYHWKSE